MNYQKLAGMSAKEGNFKTFKLFGSLKHLVFVENGYKGFRDAEQYIKEKKYLV